MMQQIQKIKDVENQQKSLYRDFQENILPASVAVLRNTYKKLLQANPDVYESIQEEFTYAFWPVETAIIHSVTVLSGKPSLTYRNRAYFGAYTGTWVHVKYERRSSFSSKQLEAVLPDFMFDAKLDAVRIAQFARKVVHTVKQEQAQKVYLDWKKNAPTIEATHDMIEKLQKQIAALRETETLLEAYPNDYTRHPQYAPVEKLAERKPFKV